MSEKNKSLIEILKNSLHSADLYSHFSSSKLWMKDDQLLKKTMNWLGFHSESYSSPLRGCFLFELDTMQSLDYFSPVHARDGVLTLLQFFFKNPRPLTSNTLLLVHERLENLIPEQWQPNCLTYKKVPKTLPFKTTAKRNLIIMSSAFGPNHCSSIFAKTAIHYLSSLNRDIDNVVLVNFNSNYTDRKDFKDSTSKEQLDVFIQLTALFPDKVVFKSHLDLHAEDLSNSRYFDLNEYNYYYSDSAFEDLILCRGAKPLFQNQRNDQMFCLDLSFYHEIQIFPAYPKTNKKALEVFKSFTTSPEFIEKERNHKHSDLNTNVKITSSKFDLYAYEFASVSLEPLKIIDQNSSNIKF